MKHKCAKCPIVEYGIEKDEVPLCSKCKKEFMKTYHRCMIALDDRDPDKIAYVRAMKVYADLKT